MSIDELIEQLKDLKEKSSSAPWEHDCDEEHPDGLIEHDGCGVASIQHHANIGTILKTGEEFSYADAKLIVLLRNNTDLFIDALELLNKHMGETLEVLNKEIIKDIIE